MKDQSVKQKKIQTGKFRNLIFVSKYSGDSAFKSIVIIYYNHRN